jgi:CPA2 family monovalent cation:H+ antiporter-2
MPNVPFLADFVVILAAAIAVNLVSHRLRLPAVAGFLLTGLLIGPSGLALVSDRETVQVYAEVGIVFLLFTVGLEFSLDRLREIRRPFFLGGPLQTLLTIGLVAAVAAALGAGLDRGFFFGFLVALSSTAVVLRIYADREQLDAPQGKLVIGILLFQDFLIVPMVLVVPLLGGGAAGSGAAIALRLAVGVAVVGVVFAVARYLMPRLLDVIVRTRVREVFVLGALGVCLAMALVTERLGFSLALGAFLAGIVLSESEYSHQLMAEMTPFRDVFLSLFFISVGMLLHLDFVVERAPAVLAICAGLVAVKALVAFAAVRLLRYPARTAAIVGLSLAQIGEFSFVLMRVGERAGLIAGDDVQYFLAASILSLLATPALVALAPRLGAMLPGPAAPEATEELSGHTVLVGFGVNGRNLARVLRETGTGYVVVELSGEAVRAARAAGEPVLYGDATRPEILRAAGVERARVAVFAISDLAAVRQAIRAARDLNPGIHIIVRTRRVAEIDELYRCGAGEVVAEEFETSIEILNRVLRQYHLPRNVVDAQEKVLRGERYEILRSPAGSGKVPSKLLELLAAGVTDVYFVAAGGPAEGRTLRDLDLRAHGGASIIAVVRGERPLTNPEPDLRLEAGDSLVLVGSHAEIQRAFDVLQGARG